MQKKEVDTKKRTVPERFAAAYGPISGSFSVPLFGGFTLLELVGQGFEWQKRLSEMGAFGRWVPTINIVIYLLITAWAFRAVFIIAERCGVAEQDSTKLQGKIGEHIEAFSCIHDVIHVTRDDLLTSENFAKLLTLEDGESNRLLWDIWSAQLAHLQRAMRALTGSDCHVCIKAVMKGRGPDGGDGLVTLCYGPAVSQERRKKSLVLPMNLGIATEAIVTRRIAFSNDILFDDRYWPQQERAERSKDYRTVVSAPIFVNRVAEGVLCLDWKDPNRYLPDAHGNVVSSFTDMMSTACYLHRISRVLRDQASA